MGLGSALFLFFALIAFQDERKMFHCSHHHFMQCCRQWPMIAWVAGIRVVQAGSWEHTCVRNILKRKLNPLQPPQPPPPSHVPVARILHYNILVQAGHTMKILVFNFQLLTKVKCNEESILVITISFSLYL